MDCIVHGVAQSQARLSGFHFRLHFHRRSWLFPGCHSSSSEGKKGTRLLPQAWLAPWGPFPCSLLMLKTWPLCIGAESNLGDRILGEVEKNPWVGNIPWRREWQPAPVFLPAEFQGQKGLAGPVHGVAKSQT